MTGKILGSGVIKAEDGNRYNYDESELKNAKPNQKLDGLEVDFEVQEGKAVGVFITSKQTAFQFSSVNVPNLENVNLPSFDNKWVFFNLNEAKANLLVPNIHSVKFYALLATLIAFIPLLIGFNVGKSGFVEFMLGFCIYALNFWAYFYIYKLSNNSKFLKYSAINIALSLIAILLARMIIGDLATMFFGGKFPTIKTILLFLCIVGLFVYIILWFLTLKRITNENLFMWSCIFAYIAFILSIVLFIAFLNLPLPSWYSNVKDMARITSILSNIAFIVAWLRFREIRVQE